MAVQSLVEQHLIFTSTSGQFDQNIASNAQIVQIALNSQNQTYYQTMGSSYKIGGAVIAPLGGFMDFVFIITPAYQTTLQGNMPNIISAFPSYQVATWGTPISYGF